MLTDNINFYNETANKIRFLKDETNLFNRFLDVFIVGGVVGMLFNRKGSEKVSKNKVTIFAEQISNEAIRIKYFSSIAFLFENKDKLSEDEILKQTFSDWFANSNKDSMGYKKYELFKQFAIKGIEILYDSIVGESTDEESYLRNFYKFINKIKEENIDDEYDRAILGGLMG